MPSNILDHTLDAERCRFCLAGVADAVHLLAGGVGRGLIPLALLLRECNRRTMRRSLPWPEATRRFSTLALASVIVLICTGLNNAWNLVGGFAPLFGTHDGKLMLVKLGLLVPLLAIGSILSHGSDARPGSLRAILPGRGQTSGSVNRDYRNTLIFFASSTAWSRMIVRRASLKLAPARRRLSWRVPTKISLSLSWRVR